MVATPLSRVKLLHNPEHSSRNSRRVCLVLVCHIGVRQGLIWVDGGRIQGSSLL